MEVIHADRHDLIQSLQKRNRIGMEMENGLVRRINRHRRELNCLEEGLETLGVKQDSLTTEAERLSGQVSNVENIVPE